MKIAVSACLLGENCKYNGGNNFHEGLAEFLKSHEVISICPEVLGGLPIPRESAEIADGIVKVKTGRSVDREFREGAKKALEIVLKEGAELVILQSRSPSCGVKEVYDGLFSGRKIKGEGVFAALCREHGIRTLDIEDFPNYFLHE